MKMVKTKSRNSPEVFVVQIILTNASNKAIFNIWE